MADEIYDVTNAQRGLSGDQGARQKRYFISMMVRTACFILTVITPSPYRWFFLVGAVTLPYISVIMANGGRETIRGKSAVLRSKQREIG